jgi:DsbC/DsbD-like thiol-disulfide interchange protein
MTMGFAFFQRNAAPFPVALALGAFLGIAAASAALAAVASASPWIDSTNSKVRLVSGTVDVDGKPTLLAGVQLRMNSGWKTYWKNPGDSGVPPSFDWSGSKNLKHAEVLYPAPHRFAEAHGTAIGYDDEVVFPVRLTPEREGEPIVLKLAFNYGLCEDLCIPNDVILGLALGANAGKGDALLLETFLARVPKPAAPGRLPELRGVEARLDCDAPELVVDAVFPPGATGTDLFVDAGDVFVPVPRALGPLSDGKQRFTVTFVTPSEAEAIKGKTLALTLVSEQGSTDTMWKADSGRLGRAE